VRQPTKSKILSGGGGVGGGGGGGGHRSYITRHDTEGRDEPRRLGQMVRRRQSTDAGPASASISNRRMIVEIVVDGGLRSEGQSLNQGAISGGASKRATESRDSRSRRFVATPRHDSVVSIPPPLARLLAGSGPDQDWSPRPPPTPPTPPHPPPPPPPPPPCQQRAKLPLARFALNTRHSSRSLRTCAVSVSRTHKHGGAPLPPPPPRFSLSASMLKRTRGDRSLLLDPFFHEALPRFFQSAR